MRTYKEYRTILEHWERGVNKKAIARLTGIPRATIRDCIERYETVEKLEGQAAIKFEPLLIAILHNELVPDHEQLYRAYAYLLGIYLGDGYINVTPRVYRLRVSLDARYPGIIQECAQALQTLLPENQVGFVENWYQGKVSDIDVSCFYKHWPDVFPQHGMGMKHTRLIQLEPWQQRIVDKYPLLFWKGLYHSDGSRFSNVVKGKDYPRYQFTNMSEDIIRLFCETCDKLGLQWTEKKRRARPGAVRDERVGDIFISKRKDVELLDREVGPKR
jgi:hypothetical protein